MDLTNVERVQFSDAALALDMAGNAGQAYRIYQAAFNRAPDASGLGFWIAAMDRGMSLSGIAAGFVQSDEFRAAYGASPTANDAIGKIYENVLHRAPDRAGFDFWVGQLESHAVSLPDLLAAISESPENQAALIGQTGNGIWYVPYG